MKVLTNLILGAFMISCAEFGTRPDTGEKEKFKQSSQFNAQKKVFENRRPEVIDKMKKRAMSFKAIKEWLSAGKDRVPTEKLPQIKPKMSEFLKDSDDVKIIWFGHSSFLLNFEGKLVLFDPVFGETASPISFLVKRFQAPVLELQELPEIDYIVISHDHYDHLDMKSVKYFSSKKAKFIVPLGVGSHLKGWGIKKENIIERDWWQKVELSGIEFISTPSQHFSGRDGIHENETLWSSWVIRSKKHNIYFSGDTGYDTHFKEIGEKYGPFDIAFIENGQYNKSWEEVHLLPEQGVKAFHDLKAKKFFPVHWGMFELSLHPWYEPVEKIYNSSVLEKFELVVPKIGQIVSLSGEFNLTPWWKNDKKSQVVEIPYQLEKHIAMD